MINLIYYSMKGMDTMSDKIISSIEREKLIVIVRSVAFDKLLPLANALYEGGVRLMEITYSANGNIKDEDTAKGIGLLAHEMEGKMYIGAGTVLTNKQVELTKNAGGSFIISPDSNPDIIKNTKELGMVSIPGALTPNEIQTAHRAGADFVKLFPVTNLGTDYIKAIKAPLSHIKFLAVGGVDENNLEEYLNSGICGVGVGSNITKKDLIEKDDFDAITKLAKKYTAVINK